MSYFCEYDAHTDGRLGIQPCGKPAAGKWRGKWYCDDHLDSVEACAGLVDALKEVEEECNEGVSHLDYEAPNL